MKMSPIQTATCMSLVSFLQVATGTLFFVGAVAIPIYLKATSGVCRCKRDLTGKTVLITGANSGIGFETAKNLALRNARVILACITQRLAEEAVNKLEASTGSCKLVAKQLNLCSFANIRRFVRDIMATEERLDILINNAGILFVEKPAKTVDGLETIMATNHFGPFLLTNLLLPLLKKSAPSRIVVVSSVSHEYAEMDFDNMNGEKYFANFNAYNRSKLANVLFTTELSKILKGRGVTVNALNPGAVNSAIFVHMPVLIRIGIYFLGDLYFKSTKCGAQTSIHLSVSEELEGVSGKYFSDCVEKKLKKHARDANSAKRLWLLSEQITGLGNGFKS